jgi:hypothetical protein
MASEIKVDTIVNAGGDNDTGIDLATNDQILLKVANATKLTMNSTGQTTIVGEGGTTTTSVQQGLSKGWLQFNGTGTAAIQDSFNYASITDHTTGDYSSTLTNAMANNDYSVNISGSGADFIQQSVTTSATRVEVYNTGASGVDVAIVSKTAHGDLA